ncbi:hypothetical protein M2281_005689 [Mesorhizobium soli]|nr:hypothetical protein [Mesorhizobium soli]
MEAKIVPADFPGLASLCWNRNPAQPIDREIAWELYRPTGGSSTKTS